jgi:hypothetical protein
MCFIEQANSWYICTANPLFIPFMIIHQGTVNIASSQKTVVTTGTFDGVHIGHQRILIVYTKSLIQLEAKRY